MNIFNLDVRRVCVDPTLNRYVWECGLSWGDVAMLIVDPVCFVQSALGQRLGDLKECPIVLMQFTYLDARRFEQDGCYNGSDVVVRGIDDTSVITVLVKRPFPDPHRLPELCLHDKMPVQIVLRRADGIATVHFHLRDDGNLAAKRETYTLVRNPVAYAKPINGRIRDGKVEIIEIDDYTAPPDDEECDDRDVASQQGSPDRADQAMAMQIRSAPDDSSSSITLSEDQTVDTVSVQYHSATGAIAGCHSMDGTIDGASQPHVINGVLVNCMAYAPIPSPPSPPPDPMPSDGMGAGSPHG